MTAIRMMQLTLWLVSLMLMFSTAYGTGNDGDCKGNQNCTGGGDIEIDIGVSGAMDQNAYGGDATAYGGTAGSESSANSNSDSSSSSSAESASSSGASSDNNVTFNNTRPKSTTVRNVASPDTPNVYPSAPCRIARSAGLSIAGGALSGGSSVEDVECTLRETARTFQSLGVPEMGLYLMCQNSHVVNGRYDKKGKLEKGQAEPIGSTECLRLVREFQGDDSEPDSHAHVETQLEVLREQQDRIESGLVGRVNELEQQIEQQANAPRVTRQTVQQPMFDAAQRSYIQSLKIEIDGETAE